MGWFGTDWAVVCLHGYSGRAVCAYNQWVVLCVIGAVGLWGYYVGRFGSWLLEAILVRLVARFKKGGES